MAKYQTVSDVNITDLSGLMVYIQTNEPIFAPMLLFTIWAILTFASYFSQKRMTGQANFFASATIGAWITTLCSMILAMVQTNNIPFVSIPIVLTCIAITVLFSIFYFMNNDEGI